MATPDMGLVLPTVSVTPGPTWASQLNTAFNVVDSHTHVAGSGALIQPLSLTALAAAGDSYYAASSSTWGRVAVGTPGQIYTVSALNVPSWVSPTSTAGTVISKTSNYTITSTDSFILASGSAFTLTLPLAASNSGVVYRIKKTDSSLTNIITIAKAGSDQILDSGSAVNSTTLNTIGEEIEIVSDGSATWQVFSRRIAGIWVAYTPTITGGGTVATNTAFWKRKGDSINVRGYFLTGTSSAANTSVSLPTSLTIDTTKLSGDPNNGSHSGTDYLGPSNSIGSGGSASLYTSNDGLVCFLSYASSGSPDSTSAVYVARQGNSSQYIATAGTAIGNASGVPYNFEVPISGWNG